MTASLVTGGAGFIGSHLAERLVALGHQVRVLDNLSTGRIQNLQSLLSRVELIEGDVADPGCVDRAVEGVEWVFHLAALPSVPRSVQAPVESHAACASGTVRVLDSARRDGVRRVVYAASSSAYGGLPGVVRSETDPVAPLSPYAAAKLAGEFYCQSFTATWALETVRLRFFNVFGPRQRDDSPYSGVVALFIGALLRGEAPTVFGDGLQSRDFTYVENVVDALILAARAPGAAGKVYNVGSGGTTTVLDLLDHLRRIIGVPLDPVFVPARPGDVRHSRADITRARAELGYEPRVSLEEGLRRTVEACQAGQV